MLYIPKTMEAHATQQRSAIANIPLIFLSFFKVVLFEKFIIPPHHYIITRNKKKVN